MTTFDRINDLTVESTNTLVDGLFQTQAQSVTLAQAVLNTLVQNQQTNQALATAVVRQAQEAQKLWLQLAQESARTAGDTFAQATRAQADRAGETVNNVGAETAGNGKRGATTTNNK